MTGIRQTVKLVEAEGGKCKGYVVDISKKEEVYKAAEVVRKEVGNVSIVIFSFSFVFLVRLGSTGVVSLIDVHVLIH